MKEIEVNSSGAVLSLTVIELVFLNNCINETFEAVEDWELQTRTAASPAELKRLFEEIRLTLEKVKALEASALKEESP
jgi:hypothetical protein